MESRISGECVISREKSLEFARLSGDFNPLHLDPVYARRLQFGGTVVHGVHLILSTLEAAFGGVEAPFVLGRLSASFRSAARQNTRIKIEGSVLEGGGKWKLKAMNGGKRVLDLEIARVLFADAPSSEPVSALPPIEAPQEVAYPPRERAWELPLLAEAGLLSALFPLASERIPRRQIAELLATTRLVGMKCPGLHSLYAGVRLDFEEPVSGPSDLHFSIASTDDRYGRVAIEVKGPGVRGQLDSFFRPGAVEQPDYGAVRGRMPAKRFAGERALVIGGSRGIGEVTAKILATGGADVVISFHTGEADAERVSREVRLGGGRCQAIRWDVRGAQGLRQRLPSGWLPTQVYFFASPHIVPNDTGIWNDELYQRFSDFYVRGFAQAVESFLTAKAQPAILFFYPSSVYIETREKAFAEYAVAKAAGETLCRQLAHRFPGARFHSVRLPRMRTDQTSGILGSDSQSPLEVMLEVLEGLALGDRARDLD